MRFEKPEYAKASELGCGGLPDIEDGGGSCNGAAVTAFCIPADGVHCSGCQWDPERRLCFRNDCDALFTPPELREQQRRWPADERPQLIIAAGPERSGSTWLYNAVRLLFQHARKPLDAYWLKDVTDEALTARGVGQPGAHHVLIKTHAWSECFDRSRATHVFVTHRDLRQVLASFRRMTWEFELPAAYVEEHFKWAEIAELDVAFEDIIARPEALLRDLAARMGLGQVDIAAVLHDVSSLPVPKDWVDPVTQIWPNHIGQESLEAREKARREARQKTLPGPPNGGAAAGGESLTAAMDESVQPPTPSARAQLDGEAEARLLERFPLFFQTYGYA